MGLTGARVSTASGIPHFRSPNTGIWSRVHPTTVDTLDASRHDPVGFWSFYSERFAGLAEARPNSAHFSFTRLLNDSPTPLDGRAAQVDRSPVEQSLARLVELLGG